MAPSGDIIPVSAVRVALNALNTLQAEMPNRASWIRICTLTTGLRRLPGGRRPSMPPSGGGKICLLST